MSQKRDSLFFLLIYKGEAIAQGTKADFQNQIKEIGKNINHDKRLINSLDFMLNPVGMVSYGQTKLSVFAINFRKKLLTPKHNGNIAVFEFIGEKGKLEMKAFTTLTEDELKSLGYINKKPHAEEIGFIWLKEQGINNDRVVRIYSELEPCMLNKHNCKQKIAEKFPDAKVSYSYSYTKHPQVMKKATDDRAKDLNKLIKN